MHNHAELTLHTLPAEVAAYLDAITPPDEPLYIKENGAVRAVVLSIEAYVALLDRLEDLADSLSILEARASGEPTHPLDEDLREQAHMQETRVSG